MEVLYKNVRLNFYYYTESERIHETLCIFYVFIRFLFISSRKLIAQINHTLRHWTTRQKNLLPKFCL